MTKIQLRSELQSRLKKLSSEDRHKAEVLLNQKLLTLMLNHSEKSQDQIWGIYRPHQFEPSLQPLIEGCAKTGIRIRWAYPRVLEKELQWFIPGSKGFVKGSFGIQEPEIDGAILVEGKELFGLIIPGIGFDQRGVRLGRGQGFYDRELSRLETETARTRALVKIGVAYQCQLVNEIPCEAHDIKMDKVVTDQELLEFESKKK